MLREASGSPAASCHSPTGPKDHSLAPTSLWEACCASLCSGCWFLFPSLLLLLILFYSSEKGRRYTSQSLSSSCSQTDSGDAVLLGQCQGRRGGKRFAAHRISYSQHQEVTAASRLVIRIHWLLMCCSPRPTAEVQVMRLISSSSDVLTPCPGPSRQVTILMLTAHRPPTPAPSKRIKK